MPLFRAAVDSQQKHPGGGDSCSSSPRRKHILPIKVEVKTFSKDSDENYRVPPRDFGHKIVHKNKDEPFLAFSLQEGEVDCWPLTCPNLSCEYTAILEGECCPRCVSDPCLADNIAYDIRKTCLDSYGISRLSGSVWTMAGSPCTTCKCKVIGGPENNQALNSCQYLQEAHS